MEDTDTEIDGDEVINEEITEQPDVQYTLIVPTNKADQARAFVEQYAPGQGDGMFRVGRSLDGSEPATHYISSGSILKEFADLLENPPEELIDFLSDCVIVNHEIEGPFETFNRLGLKSICTKE